MIVLGGRWRLFAAQSRGRGRCLQRCVCSLVEVFFIFRWQTCFTAEPCTPVPRGLFWTKSWLVAPKHWMYTASFEVPVCVCVSDLQRISLTVTHLTDHTLIVYQIFNNSDFNWTASHLNLLIQLLRQFPLLSHRLELCCTHTHRCNLHSCKLLSYSKSYSKLHMTWLGRLLDICHFVQ